MPPASARGAGSGAATSYRPVVRPPAGSVAATSAQRSRTSASTAAEEWKETKQQLCEKWQQPEPAPGSRRRMGKSLTRTEFEKEGRRADLERSWDPIRSPSKLDHKQRSASAERRKNYDRARAVAVRAAAQQNALVEWATYTIAPAPRRTQTTTARGRESTPPNGARVVYTVSGRKVPHAKVDAGGSALRSRSVGGGGGMQGTPLSVPQLTPRGGCGSSSVRTSPVRRVARQAPQESDFEAELLMELGLGREYRRSASTSSRGGYFSRATRGDISLSQKLSRSPHGTPRRGGRDADTDAHGVSPARSASSSRAASHKAIGGVHRPDGGADRTAYLTSKRHESLYRSVALSPSVRGFRERQYFTELTRKMQRDPDLAQQLLARELPLARDGGGGGGVPPPPPPEY